MRRSNPLRRQNCGYKMKTPSTVTEPVLRDRNLNKLSQNLCIAINTNATRLAIDFLILDFFSYLITHKTKLPAQNYQTVKPAINIVCDFLQAYYPENISLAKLSEKSGLNRFRFYLSCLFHRQIVLKE